MAQNVVSRLLVIGNGFDLKCDLKSKFEDYYNNKDDMIKTLEKMNADLGVSRSLCKKELPFLHKIKSFQSKSDSNVSLT